MGTRGSLTAPYGVTRQVLPAHGLSAPHGKPAPLEADDDSVAKVETRRRAPFPPHSGHSSFPAEESRALIGTIASKRALQRRHSYS